jgi:CheY-like chemotaxis protein
LARTVLLADDSVTAQNMGRRILMDAGYEVVTVNNGSAALKKIHEQRPDLIVLDVYMPGYGGLEVCQRLKESPDTARIPVLLSVGKMEPFKADEAKRVRADGHIVKPFEASELLAALAKLEDRIVPADSRDGRSGKSEKRGRTWQTEDTVIGADAARTERVTHLSEAKKRHATSASDEAAAQDDVARDAVARDVVARDKDKQRSAPAAAVDQPTAESVPVTARTAQAPATGAEGAAKAEVATPTAETPAIADGNSQAWVLGKSLFGKPVHGEIALGDSIFDKTIFGKSVSGKSVTGESASSGTPRWIAESMPLTAEEGSLDLDELMQRSRAITAAVAAATETEIPPKQQVTASEVIASQSAPEAEAVAEIETTNRGEAAFAAAASAGASASVSSDALGLSCQHSAFGVQPAGAQPTSIEPASIEPAKTDSEVRAEATAAPEAEPAVPYEAAAAWENWQQIRDSVMSPKKAEAIAESVAEMATASTQAAAHMTASTPESASEVSPSQDPTPSVIASAAAAETDSINDIVDSVLADMKPRLMAEIAKKLATKK